MNRKIGIFYFSATGNTEIITDLIKKEFIKHDFRVEVKKIEDIMQNKITINPDEYDLIGIGSPVIAFATPKIVHNFLKVMPDGNSKKIFIFKTAGGVAPRNYNASASMIKKLTKKKYDVIYERMFSIGSNWIFKFDNEITKQLYKAAMHKVEIMCNEIINGKRRSLIAPISVKIMTGSLWLLDKIIVKFIAKDYKVNKACNLCGVCIKKCPCQNIHQKEDKIKFGLSYTFCMRCVYICPKKAISFRIFSFFAIKEGYNPHTILNSPDTNTDLSKIFVPPFFKNYVQNDDL